MIKIENTQQAEAKALVYGNMVNSKRTANLIRHISGREAVDYSPDPRDIQLHGEPLDIVTLQDYRRDFSHLLTDDLVEENELLEGYDSALEMIREDYPEAENRSALTIQKDEEFELNAVLVPMTGEELDFYEKMELGYELREISPEKIDKDVDKPVFAAVSYTDNPESEEPIKGYVEDCIESWNDWSKEDRNEFLQTTVVNQDQSLYDWAKNNSVL